MAKASELLKIAEAEIGYCEKETNKQLDDKTANAGDGNYTKYARDLHAAGYYQANKNGYAWCDMFVDWCCLKLMGSKEKGEHLQCQTGLYGAGCEWSSDCYRRAGRFGKEPQIGAQIFFGKTDAETHTGIVEKYDDTYVYTIEGNTSNKVARRTYKRNDSYIVGYGYMRFDEEEKAEPETVTPSTDNTVKETETVAPTKSIEVIAKEVIAGKWGNGSERETKLKAAGYNYNEVQSKVNEILKPKTTTTTVPTTTTTQPAPAAPTTPTYRVHTVVKGDTLWAIAKKYLGSGPRYTEIKTLNKLTSNTIYVGMKLNIPNK